MVDDVDVSVRTGAFGSRPPMYGLRVMRQLDDARETSGLAVIRPYGIHDVVLWTAERTLPGRYKAGIESIKTRETS